MNGDAGAALFGCGFVLIIIVVGVAALAFWIWTIVDCATRRFRDDTTKIVWIVVIVVVGVIGSVIYLIFGRPMGIKPGEYG